MSMNPLNDISSVYFQEVLKPQLGKGSAAGATKKVEKGKTDVESSAKRIRQAVYDIRYRARREDIKLDQAFTQYMGHTTMTGPEKTAVKEKLGIGPGGGSDVKEEVGQKKYKVRVKDKESGSSYVRYATREKINQLRSNPNISSVEMTGYGEPYEGEKKKGEQTAKATAGKGLDPVGREDKDIDNDGDHDKTDKYLLNRRKVRGAAIAKKTGVSEGFSDWRQDLSEVMDDIEASKKIKEKKVSNKIVVNPNLKESVEKLGGELIEATEWTGILDEISDKELLVLSDNLIEEVVEEFFFEMLDEGYEIDDVEEVIYESLETSLMLINEVSDSYYDSAVKTSKANAAKIKRAERIQKVKDTVKKVGSSIKSGIKKAGKAAVQGASYVAGKAAGTAKKVAATAKAGYEAGKKSTEGDSGSTRSSSSSSSSRTRKGKGILSKVGSALKSGLKKAVGKTARFVAKGADKVASKLGEEYVDEGMSMKDFKANRRNIKRREASADAKKRGHVGKEWYNSGRTYSPDEAKSGRAKMDDEERSTRKRSAIDPDAEDSDYSADKTKNPKKLRKQKAMGELGEGNIVEKITAKTDMGTAIKDFYGSKSPQLAGRTKEERRKAAIAAVLTARRGGKKLGEAVTQMPGRETTPPEGTTAKQDDIQRKQVTNSAEKQKLANLKMMQQKQQMLQRQKLNLQKQGKLPLNSEEVEIEEGKAIGSVRSTDANARGGAARVSSGRGMTMTKASGLGKDKAIKNNPKADDLVKKHYDAQAKADRRAAAKERAASGDDKVSKLIRSVQKNSYQPEGDQLDELNRAEKETGINTKTGKPTQKGGAKDDKAFTSVKRMIRGMEGKPAGQRKKVPGQKPPTAGQYGGPKSPAQKVAAKRAAAQRSQDMMHSRYD